MPSFFLFSFVSCLHFVCKVRQGMSPRSSGGVQLQGRNPTQVTRKHNEFKLTTKWVYVSDSETCKLKSIMSRIQRHVSSPQWNWYISRNARFTVGRKQTNLETLTRKFLQLLKQRSKKEKASVSQSAISFHSSRSHMSRYLNLI